MLRGTLQYVGLVTELDGDAARSPMAVALRHVDLIASIAYLAVALRIANVIDRAYQSTQSVACTSVAAFDVVLASLPVLCVIGIVTAMAHGLRAERARDTVAGEC